MRRLGEIGEGDLLQSALQRYTVVGVEPRTVHLLVDVSGKASKQVSEQGEDVEMKLPYETKNLRQKVCMQCTAGGNHFLLIMLLRLQ